MILTQRDKNILRFIEEYKSITINQCSKIFFNNCKQAYYQARKRLRQLYDNKYIKRYRADMKSECIYYLTKKLSIHHLKVLDAYAEFIKIGANIEYFKTEYKVPTKSKYYRLDALIEVTYEEYFYPLIIEVDYTHFTSQRKLIDIYNSKHFQDKYKELDDNIFPTVLIIRPVISDNSITSDLFNIVYLDFTLDGIEQVFE